MVGWLVGFKACQLLFGYFMPMQVLKWYYSGLCIYLEFVWPDWGQILTALVSKPFGKETCYKEEKERVGGAGGGKRKERHPERKKERQKERKGGMKEEEKWN